MKLFFFAMALACFSTVGINAQFIDIDKKAQEQIEKTVEAHMKSFNVAGCSIGIMKAGQIVYVKGFGYQDLENRIPATEYTLYRTASVAKAFTAVTALKLIEQGKLDPNKNIREYVPEFPEKKEGAITAYQLLTNRSGIRHYDCLDSAKLYAYESKYNNYDPIAALEIFKNSGLAFTPNTNYKYTTFGYNLLGAVVERAGKESYRKQVEEGIAKVMNMPFLQPEYMSRRPYPNEAKGYQINKSEIDLTLDNIGVKYKVPGGGYICSVVDLTLFMQGLALNKYFKLPATLEAMLKNYSGDNSYGMGVSIGYDNKHKYVFTEGSQPKTSTVYLFYPDTKDGVAIMMNTYGCKPTELAVNLSRIIPSIKTSSDKKFVAAPHKLRPPSMLFPDNGETAFNSELCLKWSEIPFAYKYIYRYSQDPNFKSFVGDTLYSNEVVINKLVPNKYYYWQVKAYNDYLYGTTESDWSKTYTFATANFPAANSGPEISGNSGDDIVFTHNPGKDNYIIRYKKSFIALTSIYVYNEDGKKIKEFDNINKNDFTIDFDSKKPQKLFFVIKTGDGKLHFKNINMIN